MKVLGVFAGVGGMEYGLGQAMHTTSALCEIDPACRAVLARRFPGVECAQDVRDLMIPSEIDLVAAGFPCQDLSQAGRCAGLAGEQSGLVHVLLDNVDALPSSQRPAFVLLENVSFLLRIGGGAPMREILSRLGEELGYRWAYRVVDTRSFGLPQRRERVFILASRVTDPRHVLLADDRGPRQEPEPDPSLPMGFYWTEGNRGLGRAVGAVPTLKAGSSFGIPSPPAIWLPDGRIVTPDIRDAERLQGLRSGWTKPVGDEFKESARWRMVGNAVTSRATKWIGERLRDPGRHEECPHPGMKLPKKGRLPAAGWGGRRGEWWCSAASAWPLHRPLPRIDNFLSYEPKPLSRRATEGFVRRYEKSSLRPVPGFVEALREHAARAA